jgi:streptogramin lyase
VWLDAADQTTLSSVPIPIAYFPFDGSIVDQSNVITFTRTGSVPYVTGKYGQALSFTNGSTAFSNYISSSYILPTTFTLSLWFQSSITSAIQSFFVATSNTTYVNGAIGLYTQNGNVYCAYSSVVNNGTGYPISANTWYHAALTFDNGSLTLYMNGVKSGNTITGTNSRNGMTFGGAQDPGPTNYPLMSGLIDDLRIYNGVLSVAQISNIYTNNTTFTSNVAGWYDKSGNGNNTNAVGGLPTYSSNFISLNGTSTYLVGPYVNTSQYLTAFIVGSVNFSLGTYSTYYRLLSVGSTAANDYNTASYACVILHNPSTTQIGGYRNSQTNYVSVTTNSNFLIMNQYDGTNATLYLNGTAQTPVSSTGSFNTSSYCIGRDVGNIDGVPPPYAYWPGTVGEVIIYNAVLSASQRQQVEGYLAAKWGLLNNLPGKTLSPLNIPGCALWLDGADQSSTSMTLSGSSVTTWKDKSGNGRDLTASGSYPTITSNGVLFNGATPNVLSNATAFTAVNGINSFVVFNSTVASSRQRMFMYVYNGQKIGYTADTTYNSVFSGTVGGDGPVSYSANTTYLYGGNTYSSSPFISHSENGVETQYPSTYTVNASTQTQLLVGGQSTVYFTGTIKEVILYDAFITASQRQSVENYLMSKWGISNVISHPFKSIPPSTSQPPQFQEVTPGNWTRDWQPYLQRLAAANSSGVTVTTSNLTGGATYSGGWWGGVLAPNGNIYFCPVGATNVLVLNPTTGVTSNLTGGATYTASGWSGGVLAPNGNIYFAPLNATNVLVLNPTTGVTSNLTGGATYTANGWSGGVLAPNGNIYFTPYCATNTLVLNPTTGVTSNLTGGGTYNASYGYFGSVLAPNGNIYFCPLNSSSILFLNPTTGVTSNITGGATYTLANAWIGGVLHPNGKIYFTPYSATNILVLDPVTGVTSNLTGGATFTSPQGWSGGVLGPNGNIYFTPYQATNVLVLNPTTGVTSNLTGGGTYTATGWFGGGTLAPNGSIYFSPNSATNIMRLNFAGLSQTPSSNYCLSAWTNKR